MALCRCAAVQVASWRCVGVLPSVSHTHTHMCDACNCPLILCHGFDGWM